MDGVASDDAREAEGEEVTIVILSVLVTGVLIAWGAHSSAKAKAKRDLMLDELAQWMHGRADRQGFATGSLDGTKVRYEFTTRGSGSSTEYWTYIDAEVPPYPLRMYVRRHGWRDQGKIDRGEMIDVQVGSEPFDNAFLVEAAPADVVARMFDHEAMQYLLGETAQLELTTEHGGPQPTLRLSLRKWITDVFEARAAVDCVVRIAKRVRDAYAEVEKQTAPRDVGSPYRPQLDDQPVRDAAEKRAAEIEHLDRVRTARISRTHFIGVMLFITFVFVLVVVIATSNF